MGAELDGVIQEVVQDALDLAHIRVDVHFIIGKYQLNGNGFLPAGAFKGGGSAAYDTIEFKVRPVQEHPLCVQVVQGEQAVGKLCQPLCFIQ